MDTLWRRGRHVEANTVINITIYSSTTEIQTLSVVG
jgi:hypothetical protein